MITPGKRHTNYKQHTIYEQDGGGGGGNIDESYPYSDFYVPARAMNAGSTSSSVGNVAPSFLEYPIKNRELSLGIWVMAKSNPGKVVTIDFCLHGSKLDADDPQFTVYPIFFQDNDDTVSGLNIELSASILRRGIGETLDIDIDPDPPTADTITMPVRNRLIESGGDITNPQHGMLLNTVQGSPIDATKANYFIMQLERHSDFASSDTYTKSILLQGAVIQFKNKFENIYQIPGV
jgi:hypothetical protein